MSIISTKKYNSLHWILLMILPSIFFIFNPIQFPADDGFFYNQIAMHWVKGDGMRFNNLYTTNGFHPLWMVLCAIMEVFNFGSKTSVLYGVWFLQVLLVFAGYFLLSKTFFSSFSVGAILGTSFLSLVFFSLGTIYLSEAHLNFFSWILMFSFFYNERKNDLIFGLLFSLMFLARLDNIIGLVFIGLYYWKIRNLSIFSAIGISIPVICLVLPYLMWNYTQFGHIVPVSGMIKSSFPHIRTTISLNRYEKFFLFTQILFVIILLIKSTPKRNLKLLIVLSSFAIFIFNMLFQGNMAQWYFVPQFLVTALLLNELGTFLFGKYNESYFLKYVSIFSALIFLCGIGYLKLHTNLSISKNYFSEQEEIEIINKNEILELIGKLNTELPKDARIMTYDFPGKLAFYSNFNVIPSDGLVNNDKYFEDISHIPLNKYAEQNKIQALIFPYYLKKKDSLSYLGLSVVGNQAEIKYYLKNPIDKKIVDTILKNEFPIIFKNENPIKRWQKSYDSLIIYSSFKKTLINHPTSF